MCYKFLLNVKIYKEIFDMSYYTTPFGEMISKIPSAIFRKLEKKHACGRKSRKFGFKEQFIVMAFVIFVDPFAMLSQVLHHRGLDYITGD